MRIISNQRRKSSQAFTLIEMIGVLAVIAILASMLIPKIFEAINSARINNTVQSYNSIKTAVMDHYGKYGAINVVGPAPVLGATTAQMTNYDKSILLPEALIDKAFVARVGTNWQIRAVAGVAVGTAVDGVAPSYDLDGSGSTVNDAGGAAFVVEAVVYGVAAADAIEISERLDGVSLSENANSVTADLRGRVIYAAGATTDVHIYICHR